jgi:hypothetical protein
MNSPRRAIPHESETGKEFRERSPDGIIGGEDSTGKED